MTPLVVFTLQRGITGRADGSVEVTLPATRPHRRGPPKPLGMEPVQIVLAVHHRHYASGGVPVSPSHSWEFEASIQPAHPTRRRRCLIRAKRKLSAAAFQLLDTNAQRRAHFLVEHEELSRRVRVQRRSSGCDKGDPRRGRAPDGRVSGWAASNPGRRGPLAMRQGSPRERQGAARANDPRLSLLAQGRQRPESRQEIV